MKSFSVQQQRDSKPVKSAVEDETEKMRAELLQKERELIELKKKELQVQLAAQRATLKQHQVRSAQLTTLFRIRIREGKNGPQKCKSCGSGSQLGPDPIGSVDPGPAGMFIPEPNFFHPRSEFFHPGSASKNLSILTQKIVF
jgi:hypothetical protein